MRGLTRAREKKMCACKIGFLVCVALLMHRSRSAGNTRMEMTADLLEIYLHILKGTSMKQQENIADFSSVHKVLAFLVQICCHNSYRVFSVFTHTMVKTWRARAQIKSHSQEGWTGVGITFILMRYLHKHLKYSGNFAQGQQHHSQCPLDLIYLSSAFTSIQHHLYVMV